MPLPGGAGLHRAGRLAVADRHRGRDTIPMMIPRMTTALQDCRPPSCIDARDERVMDEPKHAAWEQIRQQFGEPGSCGHDDAAGLFA
jgi:hypothetical protein